MQSTVNVPKFDPFSNGTFQQSQVLFMEGIKRDMIKRDISNVEKIAQLEAELNLKDELIEKLCLQLKELQEKKK
jgi:hypothetical protein